MSQWSSDGTVRRTVRLLGAIADAGGPATVQGLSGELDLPPSTVHRLLQKLRGEGMVERHPDRPEYGIGPAWYRVAARVVEGMDSVHLAQPIIGRVGTRVQEACLFALYLEQDGALTFAARHQSPHPLSYRIEMHRPLSLLWGASGKSILARLEDDEVDRILATADPSPATGERVDAEALRAELAEIRDRPFVATRGERLPGAVGIAAAVHGAGGAVVGSICLTVPEERFDPDRTDEWGGLIRGAAVELSAALGSPAGR